jgi:hypothetical protein
MYKQDQKQDEQLPHVERFLSKISKNEREDIALINLYIEA